MNPPGLIDNESFVTPAATLNVCEIVDDVESVTVAEEVAKTTTQILSAVYDNRENEVPTTCLSEEKNPRSDNWQADRLDRAQLQKLGGDETT